MLDKTFYDYGHVENAIAISCDFHTSKFYDQFYDRFKDQLGGFTGIYDFIHKMALEVTQWEDNRNAVLGENKAWVDTDIIWIEAIEHFVEVVQTQALLNGEIPDISKVWLEVVRDI